MNVIQTFDLGNSSDMRKSLVDLARVAESAERYEDMCDMMAELVKYLVKTKGPLTVEERNLLSVAFKNVVGVRRAALRTLAAEFKNHNVNATLMDEYKVQVRGECETICNLILDLLINQLIKMPVDDAEDEARVFYLKMAGDYYRYLAECVSDDNDAPKQAKEYYKRAFDIAEKKLPPTHPIRLGLALNYSVCEYEILKNKEHACTLAKSAFDEAIAKLDTLAESDYKDSTLIMQLLRDNLTLWTASNDDGDEN